MRRRSLVGFVLVSLMTLTAIAAPPPNLSGKYKLDPARSEGVPAGMVQVMTVRHNGNEMTVDTKVYPANDGLAGLVTDVFMLNGQETQFKATRGMGVGVGKRVAKWAEDGKVIEVTEESLIDMPAQGQNPAQQVKIQTTRKWLIAPDGKEITLELMQKTPQGEQRTKRVFTKA